MSEELMKRARELLALRDKATPGPWEWPGRFADNPSDSSSVYSTSGRLCWPLGDSAQAENDAAFIASAHDMADTIRDLLAEVERVQYTAYHRLEMFNQREALLRDVQGAAQKAEARAEAAEARLRELASASPVAILHTGSMFGGEQDEWEFEVDRQADLATFCASNPGQKIPLIRRPEMPK